MSIYPLKVSSALNNKIVLITGGTGSFGNQIVKTLLQFNLKKIIIFSRDEYKQYIMKKKYDPNKYENLRYLIGDIRDYERLKFAFKNVDLIFHAAALKQVPAMEYNPSEAIKTNIYGAENVIRAAQDNNVKKVIAISTDKAVSPNNLYGATKMCFEKLFLANDFSWANKTLETNEQTICTKFAVMRYGNVFGSRGSVIPLFLEQQKMGKFTITDPKMTRFTITLEDAVNFVLNRSIDMVGGEIFVPQLPSYNILHLAKHINPSANIEIIGIREGEKLHECMISEYEAARTLKCDKFFIIIKHLKYKPLYIQTYTQANKNIIVSLREEGAYTSCNNEHIDEKVLKDLIKNVIY